jgi:hypothetical protein
MYEATWSLLESSFGTRRTYRIRVTRAAVEIGARSVDVVRGRWALTRDDGTLAPLQWATHLPIRFGVGAVSVGPVDAMIAVQEAAARRFAALADSTHPADAFARTVGWLRQQPSVAAVDTSAGAVSIDYTHGRGGTLLLVPLDDDGTHEVLGGPSLPGAPPAAGRMRVALRRPTAAAPPAPPATSSSTTRTSTRSPAAASSSTRPSTTTSGPTSPAGSRRRSAGRPSGWCAARRICRRRSTSCGTRPPGCSSSSPPAATRWSSS